MDDAVVDSATSEATGFNKEHLIDNNPDTYWKPTSTANQTLDFDLGAAKIIDAIIFFVKNYTTLSTASADRFWSDNDFGATTFVSGTPTLGSKTAGPLRISEDNLGISHRWWRINIHTQSEAIQLPGIWFCQKFDIAPNEWPENDIDRFYQKVSQAGGGRTFVIRQNKNSFKEIPRSFVMPGTTFFNALRNAHQDSAGGALPLILQQGTTYDEALLVKFQGSDFIKNEIGYQNYEPEVSFIQMPYIDDGDSY